MRERTPDSRVLILKALVDNANDVHGMGTDRAVSLSADLRQRPRVIVIDQVRQVGWSSRCCGLVGVDCQFEVDALVNW